MMSTFRADIQNGNFTPERLIGTIFYISTFTKHSKESWQDIIDLDSLTYPFPDIKIRDKVFTSKKSASMGESTAENFINYTTEEYEVNGIKGIGLSNELKAIYWIVALMNLVQVSKPLLRLSIPTKILQAISD